MSAPVLPKETCPAIDAIIKQCKDARYDIGWAIRREEEPDKLISALENMEDYFRYIESDIEDLRKANSALREYGEYWKEQYEELEASKESQALESRGV